MHIGFLTPEYLFDNNQTGGLGVYVKKTAQELCKRGHKVSIFLESTENEIFRDGRVKIYKIKCPPLYYGLNSKSLIKQVWRFFCILRASYAVRVKVLSIHSKYHLDILQTTNYLAPGFFLRKINQIPLVSRVSSYAPLFHSGFGLPISFGDHLIDKLEINQTKAVYHGYSPSHYMIKVYKKFENVKLEYLPTAIERISTKKFNTRVYKDLLKEIRTRNYILYFGSLSRLKGVDLLANVINVIAPKYKDLGFVFAGRDYGMPNGELVSNFVLRKCSKYRSRIAFVPYQPHLSLYPIIKGANVVVLPSRVDNSPNTSLEALSLGAIVVGTKNSSIEESILHNKTGFLADNASSKSIALMILKALNMTKEEKMRMKSRIKDNIKSILKEDRIGMLLTYYYKVIVLDKIK